MSKFTNYEKAAEAQRELKMRWQVYGKTRPMNDTEKRQIAMMQEIADDYLKLAQIDDEQGKLI